MTKMPNETSQAIDWALKQEYYNEPVTKYNPPAIVDLVRQYFNDNNIQYITFSFDDLKPYLFD